MSSTLQQSQASPSRILFEIPDFDEFGELLHDRLHAVLYHIEELESKFMLITNLFDREPTRIEMRRNRGLKDIEALMYAGTVRQRKILEKDKPTFWVENLEKNGISWSQNHEKEWNENRTRNWEVLKNRELISISETFTFFDEFRQGGLDVKGIKIDSLSNYFSSEWNIQKENEYPIISDYFDIAKDKYIGIPVLGMGLFQGIVWIVFKETEQSTTLFEDQKAIIRLMKLFQIEYDHLVLSWDVRGVNITRRSFVREAINRVERTNPIQDETNLFKYYRNSQYYYDERIRQNDIIPDRIKGQYLKTAIITILLDSFAHNISAHSLTTLSWWFRERSAYFLPEGKEMIESLGRDINPIITYTKLYPNRTLSRELYPLFKFLLEKGAFWSGITRQTNFTGKVSSLYSVLWYDFVNNPLYLGTIANTEDVRKLHINVTIYENEKRVSGEKFKNTKTIKEINGQLLDGTFATINLDDFHSNGKTLDSSIFIEEGPLYDLFKSELEQCKAFFPGGVVGKHAFFTLLENEIRNVKHYKGDTLQEIQEEGLILNISIHERPVDSDAKGKKGIVPELYKIGVWLKHPVEINAALLVKRIEGLDADIVTEDSFQPKLGGNYQDKICASMLMTNSFDRVQDDESEIGAIYYPWIKTASYKIIENNNRIAEEFEVSHRKYRSVLFDEFESVYKKEAGTGYLKKYFHIWKGADIINVHKENNLELEDLARFRFLYVPTNEIDQYNDLKCNGIIRILKGISTYLSIEDAYQSWLPIWLKNSSQRQDYVIDFIEGETTAGRLIYQNAQIKFQNKDQTANADMDDANFESYLAIPNRSDITIAHGSKLTSDPDKFNYRSHGELITKFCKGQKMATLQQMDEVDAYELFEALVSRICIFDRRIYNRLYSEQANSPSHLNNSKEKINLQLARLSLYRDKLGLDFRNETVEHWEELKSKGFLQNHFVILHLSFIESMKDKDGKEYGEEGIIRFIDEQILEGISPGEVGDNFILVITTGRGRMAWWDKIKSNPLYARFVTFRPIESIIGAVEDALQMPDDFDLKYNLTKLLFGS